MSVDTIIERVLRRYATALHYADRGTALVTIEGKEEKIGFETFFERPDRFSFAYAAEEGRERYGIESDGPVLRMLGDPPLWAREPSSLMGAIAVLTGVSMGCAHVIPRLLMPEQIGGRGLFEASRRDLGEPTMIDGEPHHVIFLGESGSEGRVFVNEVTLVVRRIERPYPRLLTDYLASLTPPTASRAS